MTRIRLLLTFDYELPLGGCSSYQKGLFEPAEALINLATARKIKIILFADICSAAFFRKWDYKGFYQPFAEQLKNALTKNHEVQLHIHPHWINSRYENGTYYPSDWKILSKFKNEQFPLNIEGIIGTASQELNEICAGNANYNCIAYRGGGYNLQPETNIILTNLYKNGIRYDSSIIKGYYFKSDIQEEDFRKMPSKANWIIPFEGPLNGSAETGIMEVPIASMPATPCNRFLRIYNKLKNKNLYNQLKYDNKGIGHTGKEKDLAGRIKTTIWAPLVLSFDHLHQDLTMLDSIIKYQFKVYKGEKEIAVCLNSHPKTLGPYHLEQMAKFIDLIESKYKDTIEICGYRDLNLLT
jgi:hypothetical protein